MKNLSSDLISAFQCTASACPCTCCAGWRVVVDPAHERYYQSVGGEFGAYLQENLEQQEGLTFIKLHDGRCAFLDGQNLCRIYAELGEEKMCKICETFPRLTEVVEDLWLCSLTAACPEVGRMLLSREAPLSYLFSEDAESPPSSLEHTDWELFNLFTSELSAGAALLQDRSFSIGQRQRLLLLLGRSLQDALDAGEREKARQIVELFSMPEQYASFAGESKAALSPKLHLLSILCAFFAQYGNNSPFYRTFGENILLLSSRAIDLDAFSRYLAELDKGPGRIGQEQILVNAFVGNWPESYRARDLFFHTVFAVLVDQFFRIFTALSSAKQGALLTLEEQSIHLAHITRSFSHRSMDFLHAMFAYLKEQHLTELDFLFQLIS